MKLAIVLMALVLGLYTANAQQPNEECVNKTSIFHESVKAKNYDAAYEPWKYVRQTCPTYTLAIYVDGEKILKDKIEKTTGAEKITHVKDLLKLWDERLANFANKTKAGEIYTEKVKLMYEYKTELGLSDEALYNVFEEGYTKDKENFKDPKALYTYFSLMVDLYDANKKSAQELFDKYDDIVLKVETEINNASEGLNGLIEKENAGKELSRKESQYKRFYEQSLEVYDKISGSIDGKLGQRANCENLIPLFEKGFDANKTNEEWLRRAAGRMSEKECTDDPLFIKLVNALHQANPSANSAYYLGLLQEKNGNENEALKYYEQALSLETDNIKKARLSERIAGKLKSRGNYAKARQYYRKSLSLNPSNGRPHLSIAAMYSASANNCGTDNFSKRSVFWLAAQEAEKAGRLDPTLKSAASQAAASYNAKAPTKSDIFNSGRSGETINVNCWIGTSVKVPSL